MQIKRKLLLWEWYSNDFHLLKAQVFGKLFGVYNAIGSF